MVSTLGLKRAALVKEYFEKPSKQSFSQHEPLLGDSAKRRRDTTGTAASKQGTLRRGSIAVRRRVMSLCDDPKARSPGDGLFSRGRLGSVARKRGVSEEDPVRGPGAFVASHSARSLSGEVAVGRRQSAPVNRRRSESKRAAEGRADDADAAAQRRIGKRAASDEDPPAGASAPVSRRRPKKRSSSDRDFASTVDSASGRRKRSEVSSPRAAESAQKRSIASSSRLRKRASPDDTPAAPQRRGSAILKRSVELLERHALQRAETLPDPTIAHEELLRAKRKEAQEMLRLGTEQALQNMNEHQEVKRTNMTSAVDIAGIGQFIERELLVQSADTSERLEYWRKAQIQIEPSSSRKSLAVSEESSVSSFGSMLSESGTASEGSTHGVQDAQKRDRRLTIVGVPISGEGWRKIGADTTRVGAITSATSGSRRRSVGALGALGAPVGRRIGADPQGASAPDGRRQSVVLCDAIVPIRSQPNSGTPAVVPVAGPAHAATRRQSVGALGISAVLAAAGRRHSVAQFGAAQADGKAGAAHGGRRNSLSRLIALCGGAVESNAEQDNDNSPDAADSAISDDSESSTSGESDPTESVTARVACQGESRTGEETDALEPEVISDSPISAADLGIRRCDDDISLIVTQPMEVLLRRATIGSPLLVRPVLQSARGDGNMCVQSPERLGVLHRIAASRGSAPNNCLSLLSVHHASLRDGQDELRRSILYDGTEDDAREDDAREETKSDASESVAASKGTEESAKEIETAPNPSVAVPVCSVCPSLDDRFRRKFLCHIPRASGRRRCFREKRVYVERNAGLKFSSVRPVEEPAFHAPCAERFVPPTGEPLKVPIRTWLSNRQGSLAGDMTRVPADILTQRPVRSGIVWQSTLELTLEQKS